MLPKIFFVTAHTQHVGPGSTFVAIKGYKQDGVNYIEQAIKQGATKIVVHNDAQISDKTLVLMKEKNVELFRVSNPRKLLSILSADAYGRPASKLKIIGITGTKGKTSTSFLLDHILQSAGKKTALLTTVHNKINGTVLPTQLTTQQPDYLHVFFNQCVKAGIEYVVMEVAAQALTLHRVYHINFYGVIFTNLAQEHAEFYNSMEEYFAAKLKIFELTKKRGPALINADDAWGQRILKKHRTKVILGDILINMPPQFIPFNKDTPFTCPALVGEFNKYNISAATLIAQKVGIDSVTIEKSLNTFPGVPGRLEKYTLPNGARAFIDYAHNPSSYDAVLSTMRPLTDHLIVVFGAGGLRDTKKRPLMGAVASNYADTIILTSDNPRTENAEDIVQDIIDGIPKSQRDSVLIELDRERAIQKAYEIANKNSIIMVLGKGPDEYQEIGTKKYFFSDKQVVQQLQK